MSDGSIVLQQPALETRASDGGKDGMQDDARMVDDGKDPGSWLGALVVAQPPEPAELSWEDKVSRAKNKYNQAWGRFRKAKAHLGETNQLVEMLTSQLEVAKTKGRQAEAQLVEADKGQQTAAGELQSLQCQGEEEPKLGDVDASPKPDDWAHPFWAQFRKDAVEVVKVAKHGASQSDTMQLVQALSQQLLQGLVMSSAKVEAEAVAATTAAGAADAAGQGKEVKAHTSPGGSEDEELVDAEAHKAKPKPAAKLDGHRSTVHPRRGRHAKGKSPGGTARSGSDASRSSSKRRDRSRS